MEIPPNVRLFSKWRETMIRTELEQAVTKRQRERRRPFMDVKVKGLKPAKSRLIKPEVALSL